MKIKQDQNLDYIDIDRISDDPEDVETEQRKREIENLDEEPIDL